MNEKIIRELTIKTNILRTFLNNVSIAGVGIMNDNETRSQFNILYYEIKKWIPDPNIELLTPPLPNQGSYTSYQTLTKKNQALIVHHGTLLLTYLENILPSSTQITPINIEKTLYINLERINNLTELRQTKFDLSKLIRLCQEINLCYANGCFISVIFLVRALLDHIPPIFQYGNFKEIANNYNGGKSFKESMERLENSSRRLADHYLHDQIRNKENLPNETQVNYSNEIDILLSEIISLIAT